MADQRDDAQRLTRRLLVTRVATLGTASAAGLAPAQAQSGRSDNDPRDAAGSGRTNRTDNDPNDGVGRGRR